jgi:hypothetical protein
MINKKKDWLKNRGYLHITPKIDINIKRREIEAKIKTPAFIAKHSFYPLIHTNILERKYKKVVEEGVSKRAHSYLDIKKGFTRTRKVRPLHYATHLDALIFGYYSSLLQERYESILKKDPLFSDCITAYRAIPLGEINKNKSTIHFAHETFNFIREKCSFGGSCMVLAFDIKSFFNNIDHKLLRAAWLEILGKETLPDDHYNVFKAATRFSYILLDDLRINPNKRGKKSGFDEKHLARLRRKGVHGFFESAEEFRRKVKEKKITIYTKPFVRTVDDENTGKKIKTQVGIPQGLPISSLLANIYLLNFDRELYKKLSKTGGIYRRYSDDIIVICKPSEAAEIKDFVESVIKKVSLELSKEKTEEFIFQNEWVSPSNQVLNSYKIINGKLVKGLPLNYLGFEFYGHKTLIKSTNLARFYRRMISAVKAKARRIERVKEKELITSPVFYKRKLYKLYSIHGKNSRSIPYHRVKWVKASTGEHYPKKEEKLSKRKYRGNYLNYVFRASEEMNEPAIKKQIRNHWKVLQQAIDKHVKKHLV